MTPGDGNTAPATLSRGDTLGRYTVLTKLGEGGMGIVYSAHDPQLERTVALKLLRADAPITDVDRERLLREGRALARVSHPNVITVLDVGKIGERVFLAMEYVEGESLADWLRVGTRSWRDVVEIFLQAARGVAALHGAGLVHRDFKPQNVMVRADRRALVMDLGVAQRGTTGATEPQRATEIDRLALHLTRTGTALGTPAYMAPEQHLGQLTDERTDQFGFCVALYEALYGERPYAGNTWAELAYEVIEGRIRPAPRATRVPRRVRRTLLRGLRLQPQDRYQTMADLIAALDSIARPGRRRVMAALAMAVLLLAGGGWLVGRAPGDPRPAPCAESEQRLTGVWDAGRRNQVERAFQAVNTAYAAGSYRGARRALDAYADHWVAEHRSACEATWIRHEQSESLLDRRMMCLERHRQQLAALVDLLASPDQATVQGATEAARSLAPIAACRDSATLAAADLPPRDPAQQRDAAQVDATLARADALRAIGRYPEALDVVKQATEPAARLGGQPLARERLLTGVLDLLTGDTAAADAALEAAASAADRARDDELRARAWSARVRSSYLQTRFDDGEQWARRADAAIGRLHGRDDLRLELLTSWGRLVYAADRPREAEPILVQAVAMAERLYGRDSLEVTRPLRELALARETLRGGGASVPLLERAIRIQSEQLGPLHPELAISINSLGAVQSELKRFDESLPLFARALDINERALGPDHYYGSYILCNRAGDQLQLGHYAESERDARRALEIAETALGKSHRSVSYALEMLGMIHTRTRHYAQARAELERALALRVAVHPRHYSVAASLADLAELDAAQHRWRPALAGYQRALAIERAVESPDQAALARHHSGIVVCWLGLGRPRAALAALDEALRIGGAPPRDTGS